jgi:hypothetical protein
MTKSTINEESSQLEWDISTALQGVEDLGQSTSFGITWVKYRTLIITTSTAAYTGRRYMLITAARRSFGMYLENSQVKARLREYNMSMIDFTDT